MASPPFANLEAMKAAFGKDRAGSKKLADVAKGKHQPVYGGESSTSIMASTPGHPGKFAAAAGRKVAAKRSGKGSVDPDAGPGDPAGPLDAQDTGGPAKKSGGMNAGLKAYLASHGKGGGKASAPSAGAMPPGMMG